MKYICRIASGFGVSDLGQQVFFWDDKGILQPLPEGALDKPSLVILGKEPQEGKPAKVAHS